MSGIRVVRQHWGTALMAWDENDGSQCLYSQEGKPLLREEFLKLCTRVSQWYDTHTDEDIQGLCEASEASQQERRKWLEAQQTQPKSKQPKPGVVYVLKCGEHYKIGKSIDYPQRKIGLDTQLPYVSELIHTIPSPDPEKLEKQLHRRFHEKRLNGEWFDLSAEELQALKTFHP